MAQFECTFPSAYSFDDILQYFHAHLTKNHGEYTGGSDYVSGRVRVAVRVYERYSALGGNRVSLNLTLVGEDGRIFVSAITSGGSQAIFFKINTLGEGAFLDCVQELLDQWHG